MSDIVDRLRGKAQWLDARDMSVAASDMRLAAQEIEQLRDEVEELRRLRTTDRLDPLNRVDEWGHD